MGIPRTPWGGTSSVRRRWRAEILRQPPNTRKRWLAAADRWRETYARAERNVEEIYRTLSLDLDPECDVDRDRFLWLLENSRTYDEQFVEIIHRFDTHHLGTWRRRARLVAAQCLGTVGRVDEATGIAELLLSEHVRTDAEDERRFEFSVLSTLTVFYAWQRREMEMCAVLRRLRGPRAARTTPAEQVVLDQKVALSLDVLGENPTRIRAELEEMARRAVELGNPNPRVLKWIYAVLAEIAAEEGDAARAAEELARFEALSGPGTPDWNATPSGTLYGRLALAEGDPKTALARVEAARGAEGRTRRPYVEARLALVAIEAAHQIGDREHVEREVTELLERIESGTTAPHPAAVGWRVGVEIARVGARCGVAESLIARALDAAAACLVERIVEIERFCQFLPDLFLRESEDSIRFRTRFRDRFPELLEPIERAILRRREDLSRSLLDAEEDLVCCAWCLLVQRGEGWIPVGHLLPRNESVSITHGICPQCVERESARLHGRSQDSDRTPPQSSLS